MASEGGIIESAGEPKKGAICDHLGSSATGVFRLVLFPQNRARVVSFFVLFRARGASRPNATMWLVASCSSGKSQRSGAHRLHSPASVLEPGCAAVMLDSVF